VGECGGERQSRFVGPVPLCMYVCLKDFRFLDPFRYDGRLIQIPLIDRSLQKGVFALRSEDRQFRLPGLVMFPEDLDLLLLISDKKEL
jgi:hypothetical protein